MDKRKLEGIIAKVGGVICGILVGRFLLAGVFLSIVKWIDEQIHGQITNFFVEFFSRFDKDKIKGIGLFLDNEPLSFLAILLAILVCSIFMLGRFENLFSIISDFRAHKKARGDSDALKKYWGSKGIGRLRRALKSPEHGDEEKGIIKEVLERKVNEDQLGDIVLLKKTDISRFKTNITAAIILILSGGILMIIGLLLPWVSGWMSISGLYGEFPSRFQIYPAILFVLLGLSGLMEESKTYKVKLVLNWVARIFASLCFSYQVFLFLYFQINLHQKTPVKKPFDFLNPSLGAGFWICTIGIGLVSFSSYFIEKMPLE